MYFRQPTRTNLPRRAKEAPRTVDPEDPTLTWPDEDSEHDPDFVPGSSDSSDSSDESFLSESEEESSEEDSSTSDEEF